MADENDAGSTPEQGLGRPKPEAESAADASGMDDSGSATRKLSRVTSMMPFGRFHGARSEFEAEVHDRTEEQTAARTRVLPVAAALGLAAALGGLIGTAGSAAIGRFVAAPKPPVAATVDQSALRAAESQLGRDIAALKASVETVSRNTGGQIAKLAERVDGLTKAQAEPAARLAKLSEAVERLEQKMAAGNEVTGSVGTTTAVASPPKSQERPPIVSGWVLRDIYGGRALVESRYGIYEVMPGANLPGLGPVETIRRQDGRWVVVTAKGLIVSRR